MTSQIAQLALAYGVTAGAMLLALLLMRADQRAYWRWPVYSVMALALGAVAWNLLRAQVLPAAWTLRHPTGMYLGALALYAVIGVALGLLVGRLTRRNVAQPENSPEDGDQRGRES